MKIRFGILGVAKIAVEKVVPAMQPSPLTEITGIASRSADKAREAAKQLGIRKSYGSYEEMLADPEIDAVYNPLPNHLHVPWTIRALEAGKHVLTEKPVGLTAEEGVQLVEAGRKHPKLKLMEAFMYRHHPQWQLARRLVREGRVGTLRTIQTFFSYYNTDPTNVRNIADIGGGGMLDIGCYAISSARFIYEAEPIRACGIVEYDPALKTDRLASGILDFGRGTSTFTVSTQLVPYQRVNIFGTEGRVEVEIPFNAPPDRPCKVWCAPKNGPIETFELPVCDQYRIQGDLFAEAIQNNTPVPTPIEDAVANMRVIEAIVRSGTSGGWEKP